MERTQIIRHQHELFTCLTGDELKKELISLEGLIQEKGEDHLLGSEVALVEIWAQKPN
jgi:hypothetical protein